MITLNLFHLNNLTKMIPLSNQSYQSTIPVLANINNLTGKDQVPVPREYHVLIQMQVWKHYLKWPVDNNRGELQKNRKY